MQYAQTKHQHNLTVATHCNVILGICSRFIGSWLYRRCKHLRRLFDVCDVSVCAVCVNASYFLWAWRMFVCECGFFVSSRTERSRRWRKLANWKIFKSNKCHHRQHPPGDESETGSIFSLSFRKEIVIYLCNEIEQKQQFRWMVTWWTWFLRIYGDFWTWTHSVNNDNNNNEAGRRANVTHN